ncbi:MAG: DUF6602 domain-containing protein [Anaerolineales bacterium]
MAKKSDNRVGFVGTQGWRQIQTSKQSMLSEYDRAKQQAKAHEVETYHGEIAEAETRKWLADFLPKRYGVTSGYVISQGQKDDVRAPHFDVIIYNALDAPVLWIEGSADRSSAGRSRAIPAEHVHSVIEVKVSFETSTVQKSLEHLADLNPLLADVDKPDERYKEFLPREFFSAVLFFEVRKEHQFHAQALDALSDNDLTRGFFGGIVLRGDGFQPIVSGRIQLAVSDGPIESTVGKEKRSLISPFSFSDFTKEERKQYVGTTLTWSQVEFARFAFDVVAALDGKYDVGRLSSFHGISWVESQAGPEVWDS